MAFWSSLRGRSTSRGADEQPPPTADDPHAPEEEPPLPPRAARLAALGESGGPLEEEALALLRGARKTPDEGVVLDTLVERSRVHKLPERLTIAVASALLDRGDRAAARALLETTDSTSALVLRADLLADEGDFAGAIATIERVLLRDLDVHGARERRLSWRERLGLGPSELRVDPATATIATPRGRAPFDLVREVARGGAGVVYAAKDRELGRLVALKVYHQPERDRAQLLDEGRVAAALEGPGIVRIFDVEPNEGWLALEWASLGALRDLLRGSSAEANALLHPLEAWLPSLAVALGRAHAAGWVHHDVKPANVLMSQEGAAAVVPWLGDFGSARRRGEPSAPGSLGYVSPERIGGRASDPRDDIYGFGRVLEDVLAAVGGGPAWRDVAATCLGPSEQRPADGAALAELRGAFGPPVGSVDATR